MNAKSKVPAIRFEGFSGEWRGVIIGKLLQLENGFAFKSQYFKKEHSNVIVLTPGSVNIGGGFQAGKGQFYDNKQDIPAQYVFKSGDIFITMTDLTPTAQALGFPAIVPEDENTYLHNQRLGKLTGFEGHIGFLYHFLCTPKKQKEIVLTSSGTTVKHTSPTKFLNRYSFFPKKSEQTKIGNYFQQLDTLIAQHQKKHDKLLNLKKALLEKLFPKQGATEPEIRFKGFSGGWEEKALGAAAKITMGQSPNGENYTDNPEDHVLVQGNADMKNGFVKPRIWTTQVTKTADAGDLIFSVRAPVGEVGKTIYNLVIGRGVAAIKANEFIFQCLGKMNSNGYWKKLSAGSTFDSINSIDLSSAVIQLAPSEEQTKIGNLFKHLDTLITQHQSQLKKLNNIKQACLEKMFV